MDEEPRQMILEPIQTLHKHSTTIPHWNVVEEFLQRDDLADLPDGTLNLLGDAVYAIVVTDTPSEKVAQLEVHRTHLDVQLAVSGSFDVDWKSLEQCNQISLPYDADKDVMLFADTPQSRVVIEPGVAAVFFPHDAHAPQPPSEHVKKIVIKVALG